MERRTAGEAAALAAHVARDMTWDEMVNLVSGADEWRSNSLARLGVSAVKFTDGPNGARGEGEFVGGTKAAAFPAAVSIAATWDESVACAIGEALASEARQKSSQVLLAPTVNLQRSVTNGRNFECFSEDPVLTARMASAYVTGMQRAGIGATAKHLIGNECETARMSYDSQIDPRTLREVYLLPFEVLVKECEVWAIMTAYNQVNGTYAVEDAQLLTGILREEWGFQGAVISNWYGHECGLESLQAGVDLEMPGPSRSRGASLMQALQRGELAEKTLRTRVANVLTLALRSEGEQRSSEIGVDEPETRSLIRKAGAEGCVLLKNSGVLPLAPMAEASLAGAGNPTPGEAPLTIAILGPNAKVAHTMGGGSTEFDSHPAPTPYEGVADAYEGATLLYAQGCTNYRYQPKLAGAFQIDYYAGTTFDGSVVASETSQGGETFLPHAQNLARAFRARMHGALVAEEDGEHRLGVYSTGCVRVFVDGALVLDSHHQWNRGKTYFLEGSEELVAPLELRAGQRCSVVVEYTPTPGFDFEMHALHLGLGKPSTSRDIADAAKLAADADVALLFVGRTKEWDQGGCDLESLALPGQQDELIREVARANANTVVVLQTGGPVLMPWLSEVAAVVQAWYPGEEVGNSIADVLTGRTDPCGRLPQSFPKKLEDAVDFGLLPGDPYATNAVVPYSEGVFVGYRHYEARQIPTLFPFGFGLSYAHFELTELCVDISGLASGKALWVTATLRNTSARAGKQVVQVYVRDPNCSVLRPEKELKGFAKVALAAGEATRVRIELSPRALAFYDVANACWKIEAGTFDFLAGFSSQDIYGAATVEVAEDYCCPQGWMAPLSP